MIKYQYALGKNGNLIDVKKLTADTRRTNAPYICCGCEKELIANLGIKKAKHFSHKTAGDCTKETYLHKLGKAVFYTEYTDCLENNKPFIFSIRLSATCNYYQSQLGGVCKKTIQHKYDLTKVFKVIEEEKQVDDFRPDILLSSKDGTQKIFIEIAVTHKCEQTKIDSGFRIIELMIDDEEGVEIIKNHILNEFDNQITTYNINKKHVTKNICNGDCSKSVSVFVVYTNGKCRLLQLSPKDALNSNFGGKVKYSKLIGLTEKNSHTPAETYIKNIRDVHFKHMKLNNCYLCKYHGLGLEDAIFCKTYKKSCKSNESVDCDRFRSFRNIEECHEADRNNEEYNSKYGLYW